MSHQRFEYTNLYFFSIKKYLDESAIITHLIFILEHKSPIRKTSSEVPDKYFVITNNEIVRLRYLVVYGRDERITKKLSQPTHRNPIINWIMSNKAVTVMCFYAVLLLAVGVGNSGYFTYFRQVVWRRAMIFLQDIKNTYFNEFSLMGYF